MLRLSLTITMTVLISVAWASEHPEKVTMEETQWQLTEYLNESSEWSQTLPEAPIDIKFSDGQLAGSAGCNRYFGGFELGQEGAIRFTSEMGSTQMACPPPIADQERRYLALLARTSGWRLDGDRLLLLDQAGTPVLAFEEVPPSAIESVDWQASGINNGQGGVVSTASTGHSTATFSNGTLSGTGGCNRFNAAYEIEGSRIKIGPAAATRKFCQEPDGIMDQEQQFFAALANAHTFTVTPGKLELRDENGSLQVSFRPQSE